MTITDPEEFKQCDPAAISVTFEDQQFPSVNELGRHLAKQDEATPEALCYWVRKRGANRARLDERFPRRAAAAVGSDGPTATVPAPAPVKAAPRPAAAPKPGYNARPVMYGGRRFPSRGSFTEYLADQLKASAATVSVVLYAHQWDVDAAIGELQDRLGPGPLTYQGRSFPHRAALAQHLVAECGFSDIQAREVTRELTPGDVTTVLDQNIAERLAKEVEYNKLVAQHLARGAGNGTPPNGTGHVFPEAPSLDAVTEPIETVLTEIGETIGLIRGAYEAREATLAELRTQLDTARATIGTDPSLARKLADIENQFAHQAAALKGLERQLANEHKSRAQVSETVNLINVKLTQLAHDLRLEKPPTPTRRDPAAG
jgi:uncharacterized coiled-coil protein SlyX